jgi:hypothetical protein
VESPGSDGPLSNLDALCFIETKLVSSLTCVNYTISNRPQSKEEIEDIPRHREFRHCTSSAPSMEVQSESALSAPPRA